MSIINSVGETIRRYGSSVSVSENGRTEQTRAFLEPLRYRNKVYIGGEYHRLGFRKTEKYLYIGQPDIMLTENLTVIEMQDKKYIVKRCELYVVNDRPVYVWAILLPYGARLEDDYESN